MAGKLTRVPQPPINRRGRSSERRPLVIGTLVAAVGGAMVLWGFTLHEVYDGSPAAYSDYQLVGLIRGGNLQRQRPPADGQQGALGGPTTAPAGQSVADGQDSTAPTGGLVTPQPGKPKKLCPT